MNYRIEDWISSTLLLFWTLSCEIISPDTQVTEAGDSSYSWGLWINLHYCPALPGRTTILTESRPWSFDQCGTKTFCHLGVNFTCKILLLQLTILADFSLLPSLICYYTSGLLSTTLKYQLLIPDLLLLLSTWCNLHLLIDRTITVKDIFQISLIFFHSQISTPALKCYKFYKYLKAHWGSEGK